MKYFKFLSIILLVFSLTCVNAYADSQLVGEGGEKFNSKYADYIILSGTTYSWSKYKDYYIYDGGSKYTVLSGVTLSKDDTGTYVNFSNIKECSSLDACLSSLQSGNLSGVGGSKRLYQTYSDSYINASSARNAVGYIKSHAVYNTEYSCNGDVVFPPTPYQKETWTTVAGVPVNQILQKQSPLQEVVKILPLTIVVVASLVGLRKALRMLSTILRGA